LSQVELAQRAGLSQKAISHWELGDREPGLFAAFALADALGIDLAEFRREPAEPSTRRPPGRPPKQAPPEKPKKGRKGKGRGAK
jgi:transcriptional regulator with XRE-family HTH domain